MLLVFAVAALAQIAFWILVWVGLDRARQNQTTDTGGHSTLRPVSIVVALRNEIQRLPGLLDSLSRQSHPEFEMLFVDDGSDDGSTALLHNVARDDNRISVVANPAETRGKKGAVAKGIRTAKHELLALTDADCEPGPDWLTRLSGLQHDEPTIVVGYGPLGERPGFLNALIRFETLTTAMMTAASIGLGVPYMGVGRNLSYPKSVVSRLPELRSGSHLLSGDDDLFVQDAARAGVPVRYQFDPATFVVSPPPESLTGWIRQKRRHISASRAYRLPVQVALGVYHLTAILCWIAPFMLGWPGLAFLVLKLTAQWPIMAGGTALFQEPRLVAKLPILDAGLMLFLLLAGPAGVLFPPKRW